MVYRGRIDQGVVVFESDARPAEGTLVDIVPVEPQASSGAIDDVYQIHKLATRSGIPDLALNIDHYLYGHPKVEDVER